MVDSALNSPIDQMTETVRHLKGVADCIQRLINEKNAVKKQKEEEELSQTDNKKEVKKEELTARSTATSSGRQ